MKVSAGLERTREISWRLSSTHVVLMLCVVGLLQALLAYSAWTPSWAERTAMQAIAVIWALGAVATLAQRQAVQRTAGVCVALSALAMCQILWFSVANESLAQRAAVFSSQTCWLVLLVVAAALVCQARIAWTVSLGLLAFQVFTGAALLPLTDPEQAPHAVAVVVNSCFSLGMSVTLMPLLLRLLRLRAAVERQTESLERMVGTDELTGLPNRRMLGEWLTQAQEQLAGLQNADRSAHVWAMTLLDLDGFKSINDAHGHGCGDLVLAQLAELIRRSGQAEEMAGRWGGEEFMIVGRYDSLQAALDRVERLRASMRGARWPAGLRVTASFGLTLLRPEETVRDTILRADAALYSAKSRGRDAVGVQS